jgi:hypothetical protein
MGLLGRGSPVVADFPHAGGGDRLGDLARSAVGAVVASRGWRHGGLDGFLPLAPLRALHRSGSGSAGDLQGIWSRHHGQQHRRLPTHRVGQVTNTPLWETTFDLVFMVQVLPSTLAAVMLAYRNARGHLSPLGD